MVYLFWLVVLAVIGWAVTTYIPMEGNIKKLVVIGFVVVGLVLLWGLVMTVVPGLPAMPVK